ncbi:MAG: tetratricopeptide repeat protein [PVC group bacterium]|nr:tetratricopeptide repeat protein [PVC group bacterium]
MGKNKDKAKTHLYFCVIICIFLFSDCLVFAGNLAGKIKAGNQAYEEGRYDDALVTYNDAQIESPTSPEVFFNMGTVFYRQKKYQEAIDVFQKSMEKGDADIEAKALYNIGNSLFAQGQLREALEMYKHALERNPEDGDTKYNIEYTERKIKEMLSESKQTQEQAMKDQAKQQQQQQQEQEGQQAEENKENSEQQEQAQLKQSKKQEGSEEEQQQQSQQKDASEKKDELTEEEAERFLSMFEQDQKNNQLPPQQTPQRGYESHVEKDW